MPPKARPNKNDKRHEAGLAAPAKRVAKDKAVPLTNGHTNGRSTSSSTPTPETTPAGDTASGIDAVEGSRDLQGVNGIASKEQEGDAQIADTQPLSPAMNRKLSVGRLGHDPNFSAKEIPTIKTVAAQASSSLSLVATILSACPLRDAIAILILFLALPPVLITTIHALFMSLTFVSPAALLSWTTWKSFRSFGDWFSATPGGGPSPFTTVIADIMMFILYTICPSSLQGVLMGLGQAVIAISLSGSAADSGSSTQSVVICSLMVVTLHLFRSNFFHSVVWHYFVPTLQSFGFEIPRPDLVGNAVGKTPQSVNHSLPRAILGCHILAQGIVTLVRRWVATSNQKQNVPTVDAEQAALQSSGKLAMLSLDSSEPASASASEGRGSASASNTRENKDKISGAKKKRKQANHVRSQQPLWAAIASTKITFMKELEQKHILKDASEAWTEGSGSDDQIHVVSMIDRIWILDIDSTKMSFRAELYASTRHEPDGDDTTPPSPAIDKQKPFFVRLNGADWGSTRIVGVGEEDETSQADAISWHGEVFGLSPLTKYSCQFVRVSDQHVIHSSSFVTSPAPNTEQVVSKPAPAQHQALRPLSPTSTLKQSIAAAEAKREEIRTRNKRNRKDHKTTASSARREIELLQGKVASSGSQDERSRQRILQLKQNIRQAEEAIGSLRQEMDAMGEVPRGDLDEANARRRSLDAASDAKDAASAELEEARNAVNKELAVLQAEVSSVGQKQERLITRRAKLSEQFNRMMSEQHADMTARQRYEHERAQQREERNNAAEQLMYWINASRAQADEHHMRANDFYRQAQQIERDMHLPPQTPEGNLPGTSGPRRSISRPFEFPPYSNAFANPSLPSLQWTGRQRSSSMMSGYSGFTNDIEIGGGIEHNVNTAGNGSGGSGSSERSDSDVQTQQMASQQPPQQQSLFSWNPYLNGSSGLSSKEVDSGSIRPV